MKISRLIITGVLLFLFAISLFLLTGTLVFPWLIEHTAVGGKVRSEISRLIDGEFDFKRIDLSFVPAPHVRLVQADVTLPGYVNASAESLEIYPHILQLPSGHLTLKKVVIKGPVITIILPDSTAGSKKTSDPFEISRVVPPAVANIIARLPEVSLPAAVGTITGGRINLVSGNKTLFSMHDVEAELLNGLKKLTCKATGASDIFARISASGSIEASRGAMNVHAELKKVQLGKASSAFFPAAELKIDNGESDITADLAIENSEKLNINFELDAPIVPPAHAGERVGIKLRRLAGSLGFSGDAATLTLSELQLNNPAMSISGRFLASGSEPKFRLQMEGRGIDVTASRSAALALSGKNSILQTVFAIVKGGTIPLLSVSSLADTPQELGDWAHLVLQLNMLKAEVEVPGVNLDFSDVSGTVKLSQGILTAEKLQGRLHNSAIEGGRLTLDLTKEPLPLHFETGIDADMADIPAILSQVVDDRDVTGELALIEDINGKARGKLLLDGDTEKLKVDVTATDMHIAARYDKIPFPLTIDGGSVTYDGEHLGWEKLNGSLGVSTFAAFSGTLDLGKTKDIEITSAEVSWNDMGLALSGTIKTDSDKELQVDMDGAADHVDVEKIMKFLGDGRTVQDKTAPSFPLPIRGAVRLKINDLQYKTFVIQPLRADIRFQDKAVDITLRDAGLCSIPLSGSIEILPQNIAFHLTADARNQQLNRTLNCFADQHFKADGTYDMDGSFMGQGPLTLKELFNEASGHLDLSISDGHIYHDIFLLNVIKFLNITEVLTDRVTAGQMADKGLGFKRFETHITLQDRKLRYDKLILHADELMLTGIGEIDPFQKKIDFTLLAAPQTTVNAILGKVPLLGGLLQTITTIPLRVTGTIDDVHVLPLAPSAVGYALKELTKQTLGVPMKLVHMNEFLKGAGSDGE